MRSEGRVFTGRLLRRSTLELAACIVLAVSASAQIDFRLQSREVVESHLKSFSTKNGEREALVRKWLAESGCKEANLSEQELDGRFPPNVICVLPGETSEVIVVGAHTDKVEVGDGIVDNWTGAVLLPALFYSLSARPRHHTLIFVGFSNEERGLVGSRYYVGHLSSAERAHIEAMVNFDSLGLGPTKVWASHADEPLLKALITIANYANLPLASVNVESIGASADSESFARYRIPRVTIHSITQETLPVLHSSSDKLAAVKMGDYYNSYRLIAEYLAYLDNILKPRPTAEGDKAAH